MSKVKINEKERYLPKGRNWGRMKGKRGMNSGQNVKSQTEAILFVPMSYRSKLVRAMQKAEDDFSKLANLPRIKMIERGGTKLSALLCKSNPWDGGRCERDECFPCASLGKAGNYLAPMREHCTC